MSTDTVIITNALTKRYKDVVAVDALNLEVHRGEIFGFLGRNGAGKTTTIRMMLGLIRPNAGEVFVLRKRVEAGVNDIFARVGYLVETASAYLNLTVRENLDIQRRLTGSPHNAVEDAIKLMRLDKYADRRAGTLSLGNKQRLSLARALLHQPELLILDEPANTLDPAGIVEIRELLHTLATEHGVTVVLSSHILVEVAHIADRIGIIHEGRLLEELDREKLNAKERAFVGVRVSQLGHAEKLLKQVGFTRVESTEGWLQIFDAGERVPEIARSLVGAGLDVYEITHKQEDLESYFLRLTGGAA